MHSVLLSMHIYYHGNGFCDCYLYQLSPFTTNALSRSDNSLSLVCFHMTKLFGGYFNPVTLRVLFIYFNFSSMKCSHAHFTLYAVSAVIN